MPVEGEIWETLAEYIGHTLSSASGKWALSAKTTAVNGWSSTRPWLLKTDLRQEHFC